MGGGEHSYVSFPVCCPKCQSTPPHHTAWCPLGSKKEATPPVRVKKLHEDHHWLEPDPDCLLCLNEKERAVLKKAGKGELRYVLQPWVGTLPLREQGTLVTGLRGPDQNSTKELKPLVRWVRFVTLIDGAPKRSFMHKSKIQWADDLAAFMQENSPIFDMLPVHYYSHLKNALEVIGYRHPNDDIRKRAHQAYLDLCGYLHDHPESFDAMRERLKDEVD